MDEPTLRAEIGHLRGLGADHRTVEIKRARGGLPATLWETISAFANADGGTILLGIDEKSDFAVCGVEDPAAMESQVAAVCGDMEPAVRAPISTVRLDGEAVVVVSIPPVQRDRRPCHRRALGEFAGSRFRVADGDRRLTAYEVTLLLSSRTEPRDDRDTIAGTSRADLDPDAVAAYLRRVRDRSGYLAGRTDDEILAITNVVRPDDGGTTRTTVAGLLAFGLYPQQHLPQVNITVAVYPTSEPGAVGDRGERLLDNKPVDGSIPVMAREAIRILKLNMRRRSIVSGLLRIDEWEYPEEVLREALINAMVHRDYSRSARGTQVQVEVFPDRLVIRNPGGLHGPVEIGSLGSRTTSSSRNRALLKIMEDTSLGASEGMVCENRGTGIARMRRALSDIGMEPPAFRDDISTFEVEFPNHTLLDQDTLDWLHDLDGLPLSRPQMTLLASLRSQPTLPTSNSRFRQLTGLQDSRTATRELGDLVSRGLVVQDGTRGSATYRLADSARRTGRAESPAAAAPPDQPARPFRALSEQQRTVLDTIGSTELSRADLVDTTGIGSSRVASILQTLRERGLVELIGSPRSRSSRWRRIVPPDAETG